MSTYKKPTGSYISYMSNLVKENGGINLAQGIPSFMPPQELLQKLSDIIFEDVHQYAPGTGNKSLKEGIAKHYLQSSNFSIDDILITNGGTEAITVIYTYLMRILPKDFCSLAFNPVYEVYNNLPKIYNKNFIAFEYETNNTIDFEKLRETIISKNIKVIFINTPGNPYGRFWNKKEFDIIIKMSKELNFYIILDAVYNELYFEDKPYIPIENINERLFYTNSFSKVFSITGWRIGYLIANSIHMDKIQHIHDYIGLCSPSILQEALARYLHSSNFGEKYVCTLRQKLKISFTILKTKLESLGFEIPETKGGYFVWAKLPSKYEDSFDFTMELYEKHKVAVIPGIHFSGNHNRYIRFNIARDIDEINEAIKRIETFINK